MTADRTLPRLPNHFLTGEELDETRLTSILDRALALKESPAGSNALAGRSVALLFEHPSTRTRTSMEAGIVEMGGYPMTLRAEELQLTRGESVRDTALVFSRHAAAIGLRTGSDERLRQLAEHATIPVVNMLSPLHHPCQALADLMTTARGVRGDRGAQASRTWATATTSPARWRSSAGSRAWRSRSPRRTASSSTTATARGSRATRRRRSRAPTRVYTDVWVSMSDDEDEAAARRDALAPYRLDDALLDRAAPGAFALHCLPAHPGEEITEDVLYGDRQRIWDQAENRRHAQKALLEFLVSRASAAG